MYSRLIQSEAEIIRRCLNKDKKAWNIFIKKYSRLVYWAVRKRLAISGFTYNEADIEDIFQEVFLILFKGDKFLQLKNAKFLPGWLAMIAANKAVDFMRHKVSLEQNSVFDRPVFRDDTFQQELFNQDAAAEIKEIINALSDRERVVISLNLLEGRTHKETARIMGMPVNTVSTIISRTKEKIKIELKNRGVEKIF